MVEFVVSRFVPGSVSFSPPFSMGIYKTGLTLMYLDIERISEMQSLTVYKRIPIWVIRSTMTL